ncbi:MAG TPA: IPTL-CTERM sorting domain-containing protein [Thermoanaerobaculia bacterium]|jgi:hypothetical protein
MKRISAASRNLLLVAIAGVVLFATPVLAQPLPADVITVGTVSGEGVVAVPVYIRDTALTPLGIDQPAGSRIQSFSIRVSYAPTTAVQSISFTRAGITAPLTPTFESSPSVPGSISLLATFDETTNLIPFTSNAPLPGNLVGQLLVTLSPSATPGQVITLTIDPVLTQLTDEGGTPGTIETVANGRLILVSGAITVSSAIPTVSTWALILLALSIAVFAVRMRLS